MARITALNVQSLKTRDLSFHLFNNVFAQQRNQEIRKLCCHHAYTLIK